MTYRSSPTQLIVLLLLWMLCITAACTLIFLPTDERAITGQPRRTRAPMDTRP